MRTLLALALLASSSATIAAQDSTYRRSSSGTRILENDTGTSIKILVENTVLAGTGVEVAEATMPVGAGSGPASHRHGSTEIIYVLSGELDHVVNGEAHGGTSASRSAPILTGHSC